MAKYSGKNYPVTRNGLNAAREATNRNRNQVNNRRGGQYGNLLNRQLPTNFSEMDKTPGTEMDKTPGGDAPTNPWLPPCPPGYTHALGGNAWGMGGASGVESGWQGGTGPAFCSRIIGGNVDEESA